MPGCVHIGLADVKPPNSSAGLGVAVVQMALTVAEIRAPAQAVDDPAQLFKELCAKFNVNEKVGTFLVNEGCQNLEDFAKLVTSDDEVRTLIIERVPDLSNKGVQTARLRKAWAAVSEAVARTIDKKRKGLETPELEALLGTEELQCLDTAFWARYRMKYPAGRTPSDFLVSNLHRLFKSKLLTVHKVLKVKSLAVQLSGDKKRTKVTEDVHLVHAEMPDFQAEESVASFLTQLEMLMVAFAKAGSFATADAPTAPEEVHSDPCLYVFCPLDVCMAHFHRVQRYLMSVPPSRLLDVVAKEEDDRALWCERFRGSNRTIGTVIRDVYTERQACWNVPARAENFQDPPETPAKKKKEIYFAACLNDGKAICEEWNRGRCVKSGQETACLQCASRVQDCTCVRHEQSPRDQLQQSR